MDCSICLSALAATPATDSVSLLPCKHRFHRACILPWRKIANTCPCCRKVSRLDIPVHREEIAEEFEKSREELLKAERQQMMHEWHMRALDQANKYALETAIRELLEVRIRLATNKAKIQRVKRYSSSLLQQRQSALAIKNSDWLTTLRNELKNQRRQTLIARQALKDDRATFRVLKKRLTEYTL